MKRQFVNALIDIAKEDPDVVLVTGDLGFGAFEKFEELYPKQYFNVGIAEQAMAGIASGLAKMGKKVFIYSIGNFVSLRCLEQIRNDACYHEYNVNIVCQGGGFTYGAAGMSHHATEDVAIMRALPNVSIYTPANGADTYNVIKHVINEKAVSYIRLENDAVSFQKYKNNDFFPFEYVVKNKNISDTLVCCYGSILSEVVSAVSNIDVSVVYFNQLKPLCENDLIKLFTSYSNIFVVEEHQRIGGLGSIVSEVVAQNCLKSKVLVKAIDNRYSSEVGSQEFMRKINRLDKKSLKKFFNPSEL